MQGKEKIMKEVLYCFFAYLSDLIKIWMVLWGIMSFKFTKKYKSYVIFTGLQCIIIYASAIYYNKNLDSTAILWTAMLIIFTSLYFEGKFFKKLIYIILAYTFVLFIDACLIVVIALFTDKNGNDYVKEFINIFFYSALNITIIAFFILIKRFFFKSINQVCISKRIFVLLFAGVLTGVMILAAFSTQKNADMPLTGRKLVIIVTIIAIVAYNIACIMMIIITESRDNYRTLSIISQNIIESQQQYYSLVNEKQQEMRSIRHEMRNHLSCIYGLYQSEKTNEMEQYLKGLIDTSFDAETLLDTGNDIVNAILNDAQSKCRKDNIVFRLEGTFPHPLYLSTMDLCAIFANTVSNAVEAIQRIEDRNWEKTEFIDIHIRSFKEDLYVEIINPMDRNIKIDVKNLTTSKRNKEEHGYGVKNIIHSVNKYQGIVDYKIINEKMILEMELKNIPEIIK